jgi:hypothetical protein
MDTIPLAMPPDLLAEVKRTARDAQLSSADVMRQAIKAGLPQVREKLGTSGRVTNVDALPRTVTNRLYADREDDLASIRRLIKAQPTDAE